MYIVRKMLRRRFFFKGKFIIFSRFSVFIISYIVFFWGFSI